MNKPMEFIKKYLAWVSVFAAVVAAGILLVTSEEEFLLRAQELNLWLPTGVFWHTMMQYPGGAVSWLACYLTQYFYEPWWGVSILCGLWLVICGLLVWVYRLRGPWVLLTLLVPAALLACFTQTGYWIYYQKLQGHLFVPTLGVLFALICLAVHRLIGRWHASAARWLQLVWMTLVCALGYPFFGAWALGATILLVAPPRASLARGGEYIPMWLRLFYAIVLVGIVPQLYYQWWFSMTERSFVYVAAMPSMRYGQESFEIFRLPYYAIILAFLCCYVASILQHWFREHLACWKTVVGIVILVLLSGVGVHQTWYRDWNFHQELAMHRAVEDLDWERVLTIARNANGVAPTRQMVMYKNLALFRLGRAGDEMFQYPEGAAQQTAKWRIHMAQVGGKLVYYHYGKENFCYRWCMEDGVEFGWKVETLKLMARTSLLNQEWEVARKYLNLLRQTTFHREWADHYARLLDAPAAFNLKQLEESIARKKPLMSERDLKEFAPILHLMSYPDRLDGDNTLVEMYLLSTFARGNGDDPLFQEMTLISALQMKDIDLFWPRFMKFATMHPTIHMPRYYQEAAYLYGHLENKVDISRMPFDKEIGETYERFMQFNAMCGSMSEAEKAEAFRPQFGDTFYYFYFLVRNQKTN